MPTDKLEDFILRNRESFDDEAPAAGLWDKIESAIDQHEEDSDPLETFIATHRDDFDNSTPPPRLEGRVFAALGANAGGTPMPPLRVSHRRRILPILGIAASMLLLIAAAFTLGSNRGYAAAEQDLVAAEIERINPELVEAEDYYREEIATQYAKVTQVSNDPQLVEDLAAIDQATQEIRASLLEVPVSQRADLVDKLIETYRTKLDILLKIQQQLPPSAEPVSTTQHQTNEL
ncbi:MAG: hypothetical protein AAGA62_07220 [Bacteroidota bacterium]